MTLGALVSARDDAGSHVRETFFAWVQVQEHVGEMDRAESAPPAEDSYATPGNNRGSSE